SAGHGSAQQEEILFRAHGHDGKVADGDGVRTPPTRHPLALEHATGERPVADRTTVSEVFVRSARPGKAREVVPAHHARRTAPAAHAAHLDALADGEHLADRDLRADRGCLALEQSDLAQRCERPRSRGLGLTLDGLGDALRLARAESELHRGITVALGLARTNHSARPGFDHRHRHEHTLGRVDLRHPDLAADDPCERHRYCSLISTSTPAARSSLPRASMVCWVGSRMSSRRLCVRISNCSRDFLSTCGERLTVTRSLWVGNGIGPATRPPVRRTVSTISRTDRSSSRWSYAFRRMRIFSFMLFEDLRHDSRADGAAAFADREAQPLV